MTYQSEQNPHIVFDGKKIVISPNLRSVFTFLMGVEEEVNGVLEFQNRLDEIKEYYVGILKCAECAIKKLKENNIDFKYKLNHDLNSVDEKFIYNSPVRSQMIVLFSSLEVLYFLHIAYKEETSDKNELRGIAIKDKKLLKSFLNEFILNNENKYYKENKERFKKINAKEFRELRNSLIHFFSLPKGGLSVVDSLLNEQARKLENVLKQNKHGNIVFISPKDLNELIKNAHILRIKKWNDDFSKDNQEFKKKISFVKKIVEESAAIAIKNKDLKL